MICQMFSIGERSGLQAGQFSTQTLLLRSHVVVIATVFGFALKYWWNTCWNTHCLEGGICSSKTFIYLSSFIVPSKCKLPIPYALIHPHTIRDAGFWTECWWHTGRSPSFLVQRTRRLWFPTSISNLDSSDHRTLFQFETNHFWTMFTYGFLLARLSFSWHLQMQICTVDCVYRQWFLEVFLGPFSYVNDRIMPLSDAVTSVGPKTTGIQQRSLALSLTHRDFSSFSESFDDVMHCRLWNLQSLCKLTLRNIVFKVFQDLFTHCFTDWRASVHLYLWETLPL